MSITDSAKKLVNIAGSIVSPALRGTYSKSSSNTATKGTSGKAAVKGSSSKQAVRGFGVTNTQDPADTGPASYGGGYGGGGGRGGGGGGGSSAEDPEKIQAQLNNTGGNYEKRLGDINQNVEGRKGDLDAITKDRLADMDKTAQDQLNNIKQQQQANAASLSTNRRNIMQGIDWQPNQQKEQSTLMALRNRMGNSAYGSGIQDLAEGMARVDDMNDYQLISAWKQNENNAYANWYHAEQGLIGDYNEHVAQINDEISQFRSDYRDQMSKLRSDYNDEVSKLYSQYWSTMSNIDPLLATKENIEAAQTSDKVSAKTAKVNKAQSTLDAVNSMVKTLTGKKTKDKLSTEGLDEYQKAAAEIINEQIKKEKSSGSKTSKISKAAVKAAEKALKEAKKTKVDYTLPLVDLSKRANLGNDLNIAASAALQKMLVNQANARSQNERTAQYVRPDKGRGDVLIGGANGEINTSRAANTGFSDNLAAFRRV